MLFVGLEIFVNILTSSADKLLWSRKNAVLMCKLPVTYER